MNTRQTTSIKMNSFLLVACMRLILRRMGPVTALFLAAFLLAGPVAAASSPSRDIVETAVDSGEFKTLAAALQAAGLVEALKGEGPFTVFAPTDAAFAKLPEGTVEALLKDLPKLTEILTYHVVSGKVMAAEVVNLSEAATLNGKTVAITASDGSVRINDSRVVQADITATNGVIHVVDSVLLP